MNLYKREIKKFKAPGAQHPIILLVDNDDGKKPIFSTVKEITKKEIMTEEPFVHVTGNLYLVATPLALLTGYFFAFSSILSSTI